jgi:DNA-binding beta-propeller fold protein YncE
MYNLVGSCVLLAICAAAVPAQAAKPAKLPKPRTAKLGIKTPGVQIPIESLKAELEYETPAPPWIAFTDTVLVPDPAAHTLARIDAKAKESKFGDPIKDVGKPCSGLVNAFTSLWTGDCSSGTLLRIDPKTAKVTAKVASGIGPAAMGLAATGDSVWLLTDARGTLSRIDPEQNQVVAELRVPADCTSLTFGETALWLACPAEDRVLRVDPQTNLVDKSIEVSARPEAVAIGEGSIWVLCAKDGKIERIDPKTNKVSKTIELGAPAANGSLAIGENFVWVSMTGFPITRIDPGTDKVAQQFFGDGGGLVRVGLNFVWLVNTEAGTLWKLDPKRIAATLAE